MKLSNYLYNQKKKNWVRENCIGKRTAYFMWICRKALVRGKKNTRGRRDFKKKIFLEGKQSCRVMDMKNRNVLMGVSFCYMLNRKLLVLL